MSTRQHPLSTLLLACSMAALAVPALAQPGGCGPMANWDNFHGQRAERLQQHQKQLHDALKLTPEQENAWKVFKESMPAPAKPEGAGSGDWAKMTAPERAERMLDLSKKRQERMAEHVAALKSFYAVLTPEQKRIFDEQQLGAGRRGRAHPGAGTAPANPEQPKG